MSTSPQIAKHEARKAQRAKNVAEMVLQFPHLVPTAGKCSCVTAAKNIRIELKRAFPGVKFCVKTRKFSMGDAIDVKWIDGPQSGQVDGIIDRYTSGSFDGGTDCYNYASSAFTDAFGDAKYVHSRRDYSDEFIAKMIERVARRFDVLAPSVEDYRKGRLYRWNSDNGCDLNHELNLALSRHTFCITAAVIDTEECPTCGELCICTEADKE